MKALVLLLFAAIPVWSANHVRIILDDSGSMNFNDKYRLAPNAVMLLHDLVLPNTSALARPDTFEIRTLDVPVYKQPPQVFSIGAGGREQLDRAITSIEYKKKNTYYYPALKWAIDGLKPYNDASDRKVIVLVTDGAPEDQQPDKIKSDLVPELISNSIRLYVIALGAAAINREAMIQDTLGGSSVGELLEDRDGTTLLRQVIEIFSRSFGYSVQDLGAVSGPVKVNLEGGESPKQVAIVLYSLNPTAPQFEVKHPTGKVFGQGGTGESRTAKSSVVTKWALSPDKGMYTIIPTGGRAFAAMIRPLNYRLSMHPLRPNEQIKVTMAGIPFPMNVWVEAAKPGAILPSDAALSYTYGGLRHGTAWSKGPDGGKEGPPAPDHISYELDPQFEEPGDGEDKYEAWVDTDIHRREGAIAPVLRQHVTVFPYLAIRPFPAIGDAKIGEGVRALARREIGCNDFQFRLDGKLPHPRSDEYDLQATVDAAALSHSEFAGAQFLIDGMPLDPDGYSGPDQKKWTVGVPMTKAKLLGNHKVCVQIGRVINADPRVPLAVPIIFRLQETPYNQQGAIDPLTFNVLVAPPSWYERWAPLVTLLVGMLVTALLLWYFRYRPLLPPKLHYAAAQADAPLVPIPLGPGSLHQRLLGLRIDRPVTLDGSRLLGWIRPLNKDLYELLPADSTRKVKDDLAGTALDQSSGRMPIHVYRTYKADTTHGEYRFRLEFE